MEVSDTLGLIFSSVQVKKNLEALKQRQEEEAAHSEISQLTLGQARSIPGKEKWETEQREATAELLKLKDRLIDVEKNVRHHFYINPAVTYTISPLITCFCELPRTLPCRQRNIF